LTAGNLKILFKNRRQKNQKLPKIDAGDLTSASENPKFVIFNFSHIFFKNLLGSTAASLEHLDLGEKAKRSLRMSVGETIFINITSYRN